MSRTPSSWLHTSALSSHSLLLVCVLLYRIYCFFRTLELAAMGYAPTRARVIRMLKLTGTEQALALHSVKIQLIPVILAGASSCSRPYRPSLLQFNFQFCNTRTSDTDCTMVSRRNIAGTGPSSLCSPSAPRTTMVVCPKQATDD